MKKVKDKALLDLMILIRLNGWNSTIDMIHLTAVAMHLFHNFKSWCSDKDFAMHSSAPLKLRIPMANLTIPGKHVIRMLPWPHSG